MRPGLNATSPEPDPGPTHAPSVSGAPPAPPAQRRGPTEAAGQDDTTAPPATSTEGTVRDRGVADTDPASSGEPPALAAPPVSVGPTDRVGPDNRVGLRRLLRSGGFRRLLGVRFAVQWADGMFQAALGGAVLFNPERQTDPLAVAAGLAVLLLPYSLIGPLAGALLDRWDRRRVLIVTTLLRAWLVLVVAGIVASGLGGPSLYIAALGVAAISRFMNAGLSVALPHVVPRPHLIEANTVAVTLGAGLVAAGAATTIGLRELSGTGNTGSAITTGAAVVGSLIGAAIAAGFRRGQLGPDPVPAHPPPTHPSAPAGPGLAPDSNEPDPTEPDPASGPAAPDPAPEPAAPSGRTRPGTGPPVIHVGLGILEGVRATRATPSVAASFLALAAHRLAFGISTLLALLLFRNSFANHGVLRTGMAGLGEAVVAAAAGLALAALVTPWLVHHIGRPWTVRIALLAAAVGQVVLAALLSMPAVLIGAFLIGATGQAVKLCTDTAVQSEIDDAVLGRVFALYDIVFNVGYVLEVAVAAVLAPPDGQAPWLLAGSAGLFLLGLLAHDLELRRAARVHRA